MKPAKADRKKFDLDLAYGEVREDKIADMLQNKKIEVKSEKDRSEEHTSELQPRLHLVCRLLLEKKNKQNKKQQQQYKSIRRDREVDAWI